MQDNHTPKPRYSVPRGGYSSPHLWKYNDYRIDGAVAFLLLRDRAGEPVGEAIIDAEDLERVLPVAHWGLQKTKTAGLFYATGIPRGAGAPVGRRKTRVFLHRLVMGATTGTEVDHHNGNGLDCRKANMRITDDIGNANNRLHHRRERQLEDIIYQLLDCQHRAPDCPCRRYALTVIEGRHVA